MRDEIEAKGWRAARDFGFARPLEAISLAVEELPVAAQSLPVAFSRGAKGWRAMAVFSPGDGANRFVDPDNGAWRAPYIPALLRAYPFMLAPDDASAIRLWPGVDPEPMGDDTFPFEENGKPNHRVMQIFGFLKQVHAGMARVDDVVAHLDRHGLLVPWQRDTDHVKLAGTHLHVVDAQRMEDLPDDLFIALRHLKALPIIFAHLQSLRHATVFDAPVQGTAFTDDTGSMASDIADVRHRETEMLDFEIMTALARDGGDIEF